MSIAVHAPQRGPFRWSISAPSTLPELADAIADAIAQARAEAPGEIQIWVERVGAADDLILAQLGFVPYRDLERLSRPLPAPASGLATRAFRPDDAEAFLEVNNRAFHWHPEQGGMTRAELDARLAEPWFDPDGFRLFEQDDRLAGFCWTKIHVEETPPAGEIYVIAVDPDFHRQGLGGPMTLAGLEWLAGRGLTRAFLYVEADNASAQATYAKLGFVHENTNRAYTSGPHAP